MSTYMEAGAPAISRLDRLSAKIPLKTRAIVVASLLAGAPATAADSTLAQHFDDGLLGRIRSAATMIPGERPLDVRFEGFLHVEGPRSAWVEGAPADTVLGVIGIFQIRFPDGWIVVDAGAPEELLGFGEFSHASDARIGEVLAEASLIVVTHEHHDHIANLITGPWAATAAPKSLLTMEQLATMVDGPVNDPSIRITRRAANEFLSVSYDDLLPIAPGVVLVKAPGHTPGSQMVFVHLQDGREILLVGDVVWMTAAISSGAQKPIEQSELYFEDREALADQIAWLQRVSDEVLLVVFHDATSLADHMAAGAIVDGLYLPGRNERE